MKFSKDHEEALHVIFRILLRQLGLPEKTLLVTDWSEWQKIHPEDKHDVERLGGLSDHKNYHIFVNADSCTNFNSVVLMTAHELFHLRRPKTRDEYSIHRWAECWMNSEHYSQVDMRKL